MNVYKRVMAYVTCVSDIQRYLIKHTLDIPADNLQAINAIIIKLLDELKNND